MTTHSQISIVNDILESIGRDYSAGWNKIKNNTTGSIIGYRLRDLWECCFVFERRVRFIYKYLGWAFNREYFLERIQSHMNYDPETYIYDLLIDHVHSYDFTDRTVNDFIKSTSSMLVWHLGLLIDPTNRNTDERLREFYQCLNTITFPTYDHVDWRFSNYELHLINYLLYNQQSDLFLCFFKEPDILSNELDTIKTKIKENYGN